MNKPNISNSDLMDIIQIKVMESLRGSLRKCYENLNIEDVNFGPIILGSLAKITIELAVEFGCPKENLILAFTNTCELIDHVKGWQRNEQ